ncbi:hypothetical protein [Streptomyces sp. MBT33]|nr:hypothetical protein [Streptomyces sp. MBT33]MBK3641828.1 hypothetical protein [Streptomyces sp. MBT33]
MTPWERSHKGSHQSVSRAADGMLLMLLGHVPRAAENHIPATSASP